MKGLSSFGRPGRRRISMQYGYNARHSWWQEVKTHAHLVIAGVGTIAFVVVAGIGLWLAMPAEERQAFAEVKVEAPSEIAAPTSELAGEGAKIAVQETDPRPESNVETASVSQELEAPIAEPEVPELDPQAAAAIAAPAVGGEGTEPLAYSGEAETGQQMPLVAVIPTPRPSLSEGAGVNAKAPDTRTENGGRAGQTVRAVTMRSNPKSGADAIGTVPAKSAVQVVNCEQWCEIIYNGKRGFVYKSFVQRN